METFQEPPEKEAVLVHGLATRSYVQQWDRLHLNECVLYQQWEISNGLHVAEQLVVSSGHRRAISHVAHEQGHIGVDRTAAQVQNERLVTYALVDTTKSHAAYIEREIDRKTCICLLDTVSDVTFKVSLVKGYH